MPDQPYAVVDLDDATVSKTDGAIVLTFRCEDGERLELRLKGRFLDQFVRTLHGLTPDETEPTETLEFPGAPSEAEGLRATGISVGRTGEGQPGLRFETAAGVNPILVMDTELMEQLYAMIGRALTRFRTAN